MGRLRESDLFRSLQPREAGTLVNVGAISAAPKNATATAIRKIDGVWTYGREVPVHVWPNRFLELPFGEGRLIWMGLEIKTEGREWNGKHLVFSLEPYSLNWYGHGKFRPAAKSRQATARMIAKASKEPGDLLKAIEEIRYDPFETDRSWLTARLKNPMRLHWDGLQPVGDQFAYGRSVNYTYGGKDPKWYFGLCEDFDAAVDEVKTEVQKSWQLAKDLTQEPAHLFDAVLHTSVQQALAGRLGEGARPHRVAVKALVIHNKHMDAAAKRSGAAPR